MITTIPTMIWLFVVLSGPMNAYPAHRIMYQTTDKEACETQAAAWNAAMAPPLKPLFFCLPHAQTVLRARGDDE